MAAISFKRPKITGTEDSFFSTLGDPKMREIDKKVSALGRDTIEQLAGDLHTDTPFSNTVLWQAENFEVLALAAYACHQSQGISTDQAVTVMKIASAFEQFAMKFRKHLEVYDPGTDSFRSKLCPPVRRDIQLEMTRQNQDEFSTILEIFVEEYIYKSFDDAPFACGELPQKIKDFKRKIIRELDGLEPSEKTFIRITIPGSPEHEAEIFDGLFKEVSYPFFRFERVDDESFQVIFPSIGLERVFRKTLNPEGNEVVYGFGELKPMDIERFQLQRKTPVNIVCGPFSFLTEGENYEADDYSAGPLGFLVHDLYHAWRKSAYPLSHVHGINRLIFVLRKKLSHLSEEKLKFSIRKFIWMLEDGEHRKNFDGKLNFVQFLAFSPIFRLANETIILAILGDMLENPDIWKEFGINSLEEVSEESKLFYESRTVGKKAS